MQGNRLKDILAPADYQELLGVEQREEVPDRISSFWVGQPEEFSMGKPTGKSDREIREAFKTAVQQFLLSLGKQVTENRITELHQRLRDLEKRNKELDDKVSRLNQLLLPLLDILEQEKLIEEKLEKEMPKLKFKKQDPFALGKGGWGVPYEELKELLDEE